MANDFLGASWPTGTPDVADAGSLFGLQGGTSDELQVGTDQEGSYPDPPPAPPNVWNDVQRGGFWYNRYEVVTRIQGRTGLSGSPLARPKNQGQTAIWRCHGGAAKLTVAWIAERIGSAPVLPHPILEHPDYVLDYFEITPDAPVPTQEGNFLNWRVSGVYVYTLQSPVDLNYLAIPVAKTVVIDVPAVSLTLGSNQFSVDPLRFLIITPTPAVEF
jgi:hypothetical protein